MFLFTAVWFGDLPPYAEALNNGHMDVALYLFMYGGAEGEDIDEI